METTTPKRRRKETIEQYRHSRFREMGFGDDHATRLAFAKDDAGMLVDTHQVEKMLDNGCTFELAVEILT